MDMTRTPAALTEGKTYRNNGGGWYRCIKVIDSENALLANNASGWTFEAHGTAMYEDGTIDWDYSTGGHFEKCYGVDKDIHGLECNDIGVKYEYCCDCPYYITDEEEDDEE